MYRIMRNFISSWMVRGLYHDSSLFVDLDSRSVYESGLSVCIEEQHYTAVISQGHIGVGCVII